MPFHSHISSVYKKVCVTNQEDFIITEVKSLLERHVKTLSMLPLRLNRIVWMQCLPIQRINRQQKQDNMTVRVTCKTSKYESINLYYIPCTRNQRTTANNKLLILMFKAVHDTALRVYPEDSVVQMQLRLLWFKDIQIPFLFLGLTKRMVCLTERHSDRNW